MTRSHRGIEMIAWRLKTQTVKFRSACHLGWRMKHNGHDAISFLLSNVSVGYAEPVRLQNQNNKKDILCVTR